MESRLQESEAIPLLHEKDRLRTEMESLQTHANWLQGELEAKTGTYQRLQQEAHDRQLQLQLQLQQTENEKEASRVREEELRKIEGRLQNQVEQLSHDIMLAKQELASVKESTALEIQEEQKFANTQKDHLVRWEQRYNSVVRENEAMKQAAAKAQSSMDEQIEQVRREMEAKYKKMLEEQASEYQLRIEQEQDTLRLPPAAALPGTSHEDDAPMGLTEAYDRLGEATARLRLESQRADRAELLNRRIVKEIEEKTPIMNRQREEYDIAMDQMKDYQSRLEHALRDKDEARADSDEARRAANRWRQQYDEKVAETKLLATQVQALLVSRAGREATTDDEVPTSVADMQSHNQRLLVNNQHLQEKIEELEHRLNEDELTSKLEAAKSELDALRNQRKLQEEAVDKIVQQRDLYRSLCNLGGNLSPGQELTVQEFSREQTERVKKLEKDLTEADDKLAVASGERDSLLREKQASEERLARYETHSSELAESLSRVQAELQVARGDAARSQSEAKYHSGKCLRLEESVQRLREELGHVTSAKNELQRINAELQHSLTESRNLGAQKETGKQQAETLLRLAQTQTETAKLAQQRSTEEANQLRAEVARQGTLIDSIRRIENSLIAKSESEMESLLAEVDQLKKANASERKRFESELENLNERARSAEARGLEAEKGRDKAQAEASSAKKALEGVSATGTAPKAIDDVSALEEIDSLSTKLSAANDEIASLKEGIENYKKATKGSESSIVELSSAAETAKKALLEEVESIKAELENSKKDSLGMREVIVEMTESLKGQREEREKGEAALKSEIVSMKAELEVREKDLESSHAARAAIQLDLDTLRTESSQAQSNYERELKVHSEARSALRAAIKQAEDEAVERVKATQEMENVKASISEERETWNQETESLRQEAASLRESLKGTREQNNLLHSQLEKLGTQVQEGLSSRVETAQEGQAESSDEAQKLLQEMREVVKFLRSENQMIQTQLDTAARGMEREKAAGGALKHSLDEARAELAALKAQSEESKESTAELTETREKLRAADEQIALLGDSNKLLRDEFERARNSLKAAEEEVEAVRKQLAPAESMNRDSEAKLAIQGAETESLRRELDSWKGRVENLVKQFNQVDPAEHSKAVAKVDELTKEKEGVEQWKKTLEDENKRIREIARSLNQKQREQKNQLDEKTKEIESLKSEKASLAGSSAREASLTKERDELKEKLQTLEKKKSSVQTELEGANKRNDNLRERLRQFQLAIRDLKNKEQMLSQQLEAAQSDRVSSTTEPPMKVTREEQKPQSSVALGDAGKGQENQKATEGDGKLQDDVGAVPLVPEGGFSFGPSPSTAEKPGEGEKMTNSQESGKSILKPDAAPFIPKDKMDTAESNANLRPSMKRQASGETMELSVKEKLMAKKRKLAAALSKQKQQEANKTQVKTEDQGGDQEEAAGKQPEHVELESGKQESATTGSKPEAAEKGVKVQSTGSIPEIPVEKLSGEEKSTQAANTESSDHDIVKLETNDVEMAVCEKVVDERNIAARGERTSGSVVSIDTAEKSDAQVQDSEAVSDLKKSFTPDTPAILGIRSALSAEGPKSSSGSGFLNMKPPDSSSSPPTFDFQSSIKLPMPTQTVPPPPSPFDTFTTSNTVAFGDKQSIAAHPLFGAPRTSGSPPPAKENDEPSEEA